LAHFPELYSVDESESYLSNYLIVAKWEIQRGHGEGKTYRTLLDRLEMVDVYWRGRPTVHCLIIKRNSRYKTDLNIYRNQQIFKV